MKTNEKEQNYEKLVPVNLQFSTIRLCQMHPSKFPLVTPPGSGLQAWMD